MDDGLKQDFQSGIEGDTVMFPVLEHFLSIDDVSHYKESLDKLLSRKDPGVDALSLSPPATFLGAYIENLLNEKYSLSLKILIQKKAKSQTGEMILPKTPNSSLSRNQRELFQTGCTEFWLSSQFEIPFVQRYIPPGYYQHNFIMLNFLNPQQIKQIRTWINGKETVVNRYDYWRGNEDSFTYYLDGTRSSLKSGKNTLVLWISS